jgi:transposase InsO family protein
MGIEEVVTAPRSPWQNAYVERIIGSIRRECLNHIIIMSVTYAVCCRRIFNIITRAGLISR